MDTGIDSSRPRLLPILTLRFTDADDPVIKECNVYLSQELADGLYTRPWAATHRPSCPPADLLV